MEVKLHVGHRRSIPSFYIDLGHRKLLEMQESQSSSWRYVILLALASGCAALGHEVLLTRRLIDLLGASNSSTARVFGAFFLGWALGAALSKRYCEMFRDPWKAAGTAELFVGIWSFPSIWIGGLTEPLWRMVGNEGIGGWESGIAKFGLSTLVALPPAIGMGLFLPSVLRALAGPKQQLNRQAVWIYGANTFGGVLGILLVTFVLTIALGVVLSSVTIISINVVVGIACFRQSTDFDPSTLSRQEPRHDDMPHNLSLYLLSACSGFGVISLEMFAIQSISLFAPWCTFSTPSVLLVIIVSLAISSLFTPFVVRRLEPIPTIAAASLACCILISLIPWIEPTLAIILPLTETSSVFDYAMRIVLFGLICFGPAFVLAGLLFPTLTEWLGEPGCSQGRWGYLLAFNGLGGYLGAEVSHTILMPCLRVHAGIISIGLFYGLVALICVLVHRQLRHLSLILGGLIAIVIGIVGLGWNLYRPHTYFTDISVLKETGGREGVVSVVYSDYLGFRIVLSGQYVLGGTKFRYDLERMSHIPLLLHPEPKRVGYVGLATGISVGAVLEHKKVQELQIAELSPQVVQAADQFFSPFNHGVTHDTRARVVVEDGRTFICSSPNRFDVVIADLFLPWAPGEARLYSIEHFRSVYDALQEGGVFCQWLAAYQLTRSQLETITRSMQTSFSDVHMFRYNFDDKTPALALVGIKRRQLDWSVVEGNCVSVRSDNSVTDPLMRHWEGLSMLYLGRRSELGVGEVNTLANMTLEISAGRTQVSKKLLQSYLSSDQWMQFLQELQPQVQPNTDLWQVWSRLGYQLTLIEIGLREQKSLDGEQRNQLAQLQDSVFSSIPKPVLEDSQADWSKGPGRMSRMLSK